MILGNPTQLRPGATGILSGIEYRVVGRVVLSEAEADGLYYWNEFNLETASGENATLVYEETRRGREWRLFTMFEPGNPLTAGEAATKRVGDALNLDGTPARVTFVSRSLVCRVEGRAPEGEHTGARADYFNAETGASMIVVSWTGDEVECYHGMTLAPGAVEKAFHIPQPILGTFVSYGSSRRPASNLAPVLVLAMAVMSMFFFIELSSRRRIMPRTPAVVRRIAAPSSPLRVGSSGNLHERHYRLAAHEVVEFAETGLRFERHEFQLLDDDGEPALLVLGAKPGAKDWILFTPPRTAVMMTPAQAGAVHLGQRVSVDGVTAPVSELFSSTARRAADSPSPEQAGVLVRYGFSGRSGATELLARWNEREITFRCGHILSAKEVLAAFGK